MSDRLYAWRNGWRWALRSATPMAALRVLWDAYVRGHNGETCYFCGRPYMLWHAPDALWERFSGHSGLCCPACFDRRARRSGVRLIWQPVVFQPTSPGVLWDQEASLRRLYGAVMATTTVATLRAAEDHPDNAPERELIDAIVATEGALGMPL